MPQPILGVRPEKMMAHAVKSQDANLNSCLFLTFSLFYGMHLVAPGRTFSCQGRGKMPAGVQQHVPKDCIKTYAL